MMTVMTANNLQQSAIAFTREMAQSILECDREFPIDLDEAWQWLGYSTKQKALQFLKNNFEEGEDFLTQRLKTSTGGRPSDSIVLTIECLKSFGMMTGTSQGKQIRKYFLQCERVAKAMSLSKKEPSLCTTETGLLKLGKLVRAQRESLNLKLSDVVEKILKQTGYKWSVSSLSKFEVGHMYFDPNFVALILAVLPIPHPIEDRSFTEFEIWEIARENLDHVTGVYLASNEVSAQKLMNSGNIIKPKFSGEDLIKATARKQIIPPDEAILGKRFGRLEAVRKVLDTRKWVCFCDCGNTREISDTLLLNGKSKSCGCLFQEIRSKRA
jgi:phage anti-repressor protein